MNKVSEENKLLQSELYASQLLSYSSKGNHNILFVSPQLSGRQLYKSIIPYLFLKSGNILQYGLDCVASLTDLKKYDPIKQLVEGDIDISGQAIQWADFIVLPFTIQPMAIEPIGNSLYQQIRDIKKTFGGDVKICYSVDFNFYELPENNSYFNIFKEQRVIDHVESNMINSDRIIVTNQNLRVYLIRKFAQKGIDLESKIICVPFLIDEDIVKANIDFVPRETEIRVSTKKHDKPRSKSKQVIDTDKLKVGVICTPNSFDDLKYFNRTFKELNKMPIELIFIGFDGIIKNGNKQRNALSGIDFKYVGKVSIIHYFKQLKELNLDIVLIPLKENRYNQTSENYTKFMEAGIFDIPVLAPNIYPYYRLIANKSNGLVYNKPKDIISILDHFSKHKATLKEVGERAHKFINETFNIKNFNLIKHLIDVYK